MSMFLNWLIISSETWGRSADFWRLSCSRFLRYVFDKNSRRGVVKLILNSKRKIFAHNWCRLNFHFLNNFFLLLIDFITHPLLFHFSFYSFFQPLVVCLQHQAFLLCSFNLIFKSFLLLLHALYVQLELVLNSYMLSHVWF